MSEKKSGDSSMMSVFWQSLLATTMSIVLTFGVAGVIDYYKKKSEQREIVMMQMYDMYNSLQMVEQADQTIYQSMELHCKVAEDTTLFEQERFTLIHMAPTIEYTKSVENIFNSTIETILTIGNVLYEEDVAAFYKARESYKNNVCDLFYQEAVKDGVATDLRKFIEYDYYTIALVSNYLLYDMREHFASCKRMVNVSDEELQAYIERRRKLEIDNSTATPKDSVDDRALELFMRKEEAIRALGW